MPCFESGPWLPYSAGRAVTRHLPSIISQVSTHVAVTTALVMSIASDGSHTSQLLEASGSFTLATRAGASCAMSASPDSPNIAATHAKCQLPSATGEWKASTLGYAFPQLPYPKPGPFAGHPSGNAQPEPQLGTCRTRRRIHGKSHPLHQNRH